jgi:plasmid stability protein
MAQLLICKLKNPVKAGLRRMTQRYHCSTEEMARSILRVAVSAKVDEQADCMPISAHFRKYGFKKGQFLKLGKVVYPARSHASR